MKNEEKHSEICKYYLLGHTIKETAAYFGIKTYQIVSKILKENGIEVRSVGSYHKSKGINHEYFDVIDNEEKAYFIGFIAADGYITPNGGKLAFGLNVKDVEILEKFCQLTKCQNKISVSKVWDKRTKKYYDRCSLQVCCKELVLSLKKYGLDNNKTKEYVIQNIPEKYMKDCIRGMVDGDGHIGKNTVSLITTMQNIEIISEFLLKINIIRQNHIEDVKSEENTYKMYIGKDSDVFLKKIYEDCKICLSRKFESYKKHVYKKNNPTRKISNRVVFAYKNNEFFKEYASVKECSLDLNIPSGSICNIMAGRHKTYKGFSFARGEKKIIITNINKGKK